MAQFSWWQIAHFFSKLKNPSSVLAALTWTVRVPQPARVPPHRPLDGMVWNGTVKPILNDHGIVTRYEGAWVHANADDAPGVQPARKPSHRPRKGMEWNGKATAITNAEGELTAYADAWVHADAEDQTSAVEPAARPGGRPPTGKVGMAQHT